MKNLITLLVSVSFLHTSFSQVVSSVVQQTNASCNGLCDGTAVIVTTGGQPPYTITGPASNAPQTYSSIVTLTGICAGTTTFLVTDALNQTAPVIVFINQPIPLVLSTNPTNENSLGACDGQIVATANGGTSPYTYTINGGTSQGSNTFGNLCAGSYQVCVTDANGCTSCNTIVTVGSNSGANCSNFAVTSVQQQNISCNGTCDGSVFLLATGAQPPYIVSGNFTNSPITFTSGTTLSGFCAGPQVVGVTSADGCVFQYTMVFTEPTQLNLSVVTYNETSVGACNGTIEASANGGTAPYTFTVNGQNQTSGNINNLCAGVYQVCVIDANGCSSCNMAVQIGSGASGCLLTSTVLQQSTLQCNGDCNGTAVITTTGGQMPYTATGSFTNSPAIYTSMGTLAGFCAGTNIVTITDNAGCSSQITIVYNEPSPLVLTTNPINESSLGACDGQIVAAANGGTAPYTYTLNGSGQPTSTMNNLCAGSYQVCVTDANGCTSCNTVVTVGTNNNSNCTNFAVTSVQQQNISCNGICDGSVFLLASGAQPPYIVSGNFNNSPITFTSGTTLSGFCAGPQIVSVTSADGCVFQYTMVFTQPTPLNFSVVTYNETSVGACNGSIEASANGGTAPYTYTVNGQNQTSGNINNLCAGVYQVCVIDANGCSSCNMAVQIGSGASGCNLVTTQFQHTPTSCFGTCDGSVVIAASGGQLPYVVTGNFPGSPYTFTSSAYLQGLCGGATTLTVTSNDGCVGNMTVTINAPTIIQVNPTIVTNLSSSGACDAVLTGTATGGTPGYVYNWIDCITQTSFGTQPTIGNICAGDYAFQATDMNGCTVTSTCINVSATSSIDATKSIVDFSIFPNPSNGLFSVELNSSIESQIEMSIQDISGSIVYKTILSEDFQTFDLKNELSNGVYLVTLNGISNKTFKLVIQK